MDLEVCYAKAITNLYISIKAANANTLEPNQNLRAVFTELPDAKTVKLIEALLLFKPKIELDKAA